MTPKLAKANERPDALLVYFGNNPDAMENVIVKFPAIEIPKKKIKMIFAMRFSVKSTPINRRKEIIKLNSRILFFLKCFISLLRRSIPISIATPNMERKRELILISIFILLKYDVNHTKNVFITEI